MRVFLIRTYKLFAWLNDCIVNAILNGSNIPKFIIIVKNESQVRFR